MEPELPSQKNHLTCLPPPTFGTAKQGPINHGRASGNTMSQRTVCKDNKKADNYAYQADGYQTEC